MEKRSPDITKCRATMLGAGQLVYCRSDHQGECDYAMPFGVKHFCVHPQSTEIATRTAANANADRGNEGPD